jgi:hypothetical protein
MGIETAPLDVEESTEPPICGYSHKHPLQDHNRSRDVKDALDSEKAATTLSDEPESIAYNSEQDLPASADHAHILSPSSLSALLKVDLQYVSSRVPFASVDHVDMGSPTRRPLLVLHEMGQIVSGRWKDYPYGRSS